jgi:TatD DNase family protein
VLFADFQNPWYTFNEILQIKSGHQALLTSFMLIDTHSHLDMDQFDPDRDQVLHRAQAAGIHKIITIGTDLPSSEQAIALAEKHPWVHATVGVHPHEVKSLDREGFKKLSELSQNPSVVAIGETGLDYYYKYSPPELQIRWFREQIRLARSRRLPLVIHSRDAKEETLLLLEQEKAQEVGGVFHCFTGDHEMAERALTMGFYISFSGIVTFPKARDLQEIARVVPMERLLVETDSPYLTPVPHRGQRNEPAYVRLVATKIAELRGISLEEVAEITSSNAMKLFKLKEELSRS